MKNLHSRDARTLSDRNTAFNAIIDMARIDPESGDNVNAPSHYMLWDNLEAIEVIRKTLSTSEWKGYCKGSILKYRLRAGKKSDGAEDLAKAAVYEGWLRE